MAGQDLSPALIVKDLKTHLIGQRVLYYRSIGSTMDVARQAARKGAAEGTIVVAEEQTAGRGRLGRNWLSPAASGIALSVILRPSRIEFPRLTMVASLAVVRSIEEVSGLKPQIKWPNDVLIRGRKVCGILIEGELAEDRVDWAILGIGINVNLDLTLFPDLSTSATSLSCELGREVSRLELLRSLLVALEGYYLGLRLGEPIHFQWVKRLETLGKWVRVTSGDWVEEGVAESVDEEGRLLVRRADGRVVPIVAGDVTLRS